VIKVCLSGQTKVTPHENGCLPKAKPSLHQSDLGFIKTSLNTGVCQVDLLCLENGVYSFGTELFHFPNTTFTNNVISALLNKSNIQVTFSYFILLSLLANTSMILKLLYLYGDIDSFRLKLLF